MAGELSDEQRLAAVYDPLDPDRSDLDVYAGIVEEFGARRVLDLGCGTGTFACMLAGRGIEVIGVDPDAASLEVAQTKANAVPPGTQADLVTMTANVAQVFLTDEAWAATLRGAFAVLHPGGRLVFETRDPSKRAWLGWTKEKTRVQADVPGLGMVEEWVEMGEVDGPFVTFSAVVTFHREGIVLRPQQTLRFRSKAQVDASLQAAGFVVEDVRDARDRPGREFVFFARRAAP